MKILSIKTKIPKKASILGLYTAILIGWSFLIQPTNANASNAVYSSIHTCRINWSKTDSDSHKMALHENETPKEMEHKKPIKRKRRRRFIRRKKRIQ